MDSSNPSQAHGKAAGGPRYAEAEMAAMSDFLQTFDGDEEAYDPVEAAHGRGAAPPGGGGDNSGTGPGTGPGKWTNAVRAASGSSGDNRRSSGPVRGTRLRSRRPREVPVKNAARTKRQRESDDEDGDDNDEEDDVEEDEEEREEEQDDDDDQEEDEATEEEDDTESEDERTSRRARAARKRPKTKAAATAATAGAGAQHLNAKHANKKRRSRPSPSAAASFVDTPGVDDDDDDNDNDDDNDDQQDSDDRDVFQDDMTRSDSSRSHRAGGGNSYGGDGAGGGGGGGGGFGNGSASSRQTKLTELEDHVRELERQNLYLKQTMLLGSPELMVPGAKEKPNTAELLAERTKVVQEMVVQLNAPFLSLGDASQVWHQNCRIGVGVRDWDAFGRLQTISLWNLIRSVFATIAVDIVELRPHLPDGEMILTKWRIQGEIANAAQLKTVCSSEDCPPMMKSVLQAIKSSDLTFTVTTYVIFQDGRIAEQHHCWDQVGVFKRLFGGEIPPSIQKMLVIP